MARFHFCQRVCLQTVDQIVSFDAETFAPAHFDVRTLAIFFRQFETDSSHAAGG
jgi:hypothetical protein